MQLYGKSGKPEHMPGKMGAMMEKNGFTMNGLSKIYAVDKTKIDCNIPEAVGADVAITPQKRQSDIRFYRDDMVKGN